MFNPLLKPLPTIEILEKNPTASKPHGTHGCAGNVNRETPPPAIFVQCTKKKWTKVNDSKQKMSFAPNMPGMNGHLHFVEDKFFKYVSSRAFL